MAHAMVGRNTRNCLSVSQGGAGPGCCPRAGTVRHDCNILRHQQVTERPFLLSAVRNRLERKSLNSLLVHPTSYWLNSFLHIPPYCSFSAQPAGAQVDEQRAGAAAPGVQPPGGLTSLNKTVPWMVLRTGG